jgi:hypothetical protein
VSEMMAVMYSGGVDSTLVASQVAGQAKRVYLITCVSHCHVLPKSANGTPQHMLARIDLLKAKHPQTEFIHVILQTKKLQEFFWNRFALQDLLTVGLWRNLPCSCGSPANFGCVLMYCIKNKINDLYWGGNVMMAGFPYQHPACVEKLGEFSKAYGVNLHSPVLWHQNEDVMMLYQFDSFRNSPAIQNNIGWGKTTTQDASKLGIEKGDVKFDFEKKNRNQITCKQDTFVTYSQFFWFYRRGGFEKMQEVMMKLLIMQAGRLKKVIDQHLATGRHAELFS